MRGAGMSDLNVNVTANVSGFTRGISEADSVLRNFVGSSERSTQDTMSFMGAMGSALTSTFTEPIIGALSNATDAFVDFDQQMRAIEVVTETSGLQTMESIMTDVSNKAKEIGKNSLYSAQEAADAMEIMAKAGLNTEAVLGSIDSTMKLAAGSGTDLYLATDTVTTAMRMFGYDLSNTEAAMASAAEVSNVLMVAANESAIDVSELANSFRYIGPIAGSMGMSIQDVSVALSVLGNNGIRATQAGTTLRRVFQNLLRPTEEQAAKMEELGISMFDANGKTKEFSEIMDTLRHVLKQGTDEQRAYLTSLIGDTTAMSGLNALVNTSAEDWDRLTDAINNSDGAIEKASDTLTGGLGGSIEKAKGKVESLKLTFMEEMEPTLKSIVDKFGSLVEWFENLSVESKKTIIGIVGFTAALGPMMVAINATYKTVTLFKTVMGTIIPPQSILHLKNAGTYFSIFGENAKMAALNVNKAGMASYYMGGQLKVLGKGFKSLSAALGPAGWLMLGLTVGIPLLQKFTTLLDSSAERNKKHAEQINKTTKENISNYNAERDAIKDLSKTREDNYKTSISNATAENKLGNKTFKRLQEVMSEERKGAAQKAYINTLVERLNSQYDDLNLKYNEETDSLSKSNEEIRKYIDNQFEKAKAIANEELLVQAYKDEEAAATSLNDTNAQILDKKKDIADQEERVAKAQEKVDSLENAKLSRNPEMKQKYKDAADALLKEETTLKGLNKEMDTLSGNAKTFKEEVDKSADSALTLENKLANAEMPIDDWIKQIKDAKISIPEGFKEAIESGQLGAVQSAEEMVEIIAGIINEIPEDVDISEGLGKVLQDSVDRGVDFVDINGQKIPLEFIQEVVKTFQDDTTIKTETDKLSKEAVGPFKEHFSLENGKGDVNNYLAGALAAANKELQDKNLQGVMTRIASYSHAGVTGKKGWDEHSPSKKAKKAAEYYFIGAIQGAKGMEKEVVIEFEKIAAESAKGYAKELSTKKSLSTIRSAMVNNIVKATKLTAAEKKKAKKDAKSAGTSYATAYNKALASKKKDIKKTAQEMSKTINDAFASVKLELGITKSKPADALKQDFADLNSTLVKYESLMKKNFSKKEKKKFDSYQASIKKYQSQISSYYNQLDGLYTKLDEANDKLEEAVGLWQDYKDSVYSAFKSFSTISSIDMNMEGVDEEAVTKATNKLEKAQLSLDGLQSSYDEANDAMNRYASQMLQSESVIADSEEQLQKLRKERDIILSDKDAFSNVDTVARYNELNAVISGLESTIKKENSSIKSLQQAYEQQAGLLEQRANEIANATTIVSAAEDALKEAETTMVDKGTRGAAQFLEEMENKLNLASAFDEQIRQLTEMGLNSTAIQEIVQMGVEQGSQYASALMDGLTPDMVGKMNDMQSQIESIGDNLGVKLADTFYGAGVDAARGIVEGLVSQIASIENMIGQLVGAMENAYKAALQIKSPSKKFMNMTDEVGNAIVKSLENSESDVKKEMNNLSGIMLGEYGSDSLDTMVTDALDVWIDKTEQFKEVLESLSDVKLDMLGDAKTSAESGLLEIGSNISPEEQKQGDTYIFNSPKQMSPEEQAIAMKRAKRQQELGF